MVIKYAKIIFRVDQNFSFERKSNSILKGKNGPFGIRIIVAVLKIDGVPK